MKLFSNLDSGNLRFYTWLSQIRWLSSYKAKIMVVAFLGTHVPLLTLLTSFLVTHSISWESAIDTLAIALLATLAGTAMTLLALHYLLAPVLLASLSLRNYLNRRQLPNLPVHFTDEVGTLMADTTRTLNQLDDAIHYMAYYDDLTGLPNRTLFCDRLQQLLLQAQTDRQPLAVLFVALNNLEDINNALGAKTGDLLLRTVVQQLPAVLPVGTLLSRWSEETLALVQRDINPNQTVPALAQTILTCLSTPVVLDKHEVRPHASIGISIFSAEFIEVDELVQQASTALEQAKKQGYSNYQFYSTEMNVQLQERLALENELSYALPRQELLLHYQPRLDARTGGMVAVEALIRWQNPARGLVSPAKFIPIAESNRLILAIGEWVLRTACQQNKAWQVAGLPPIRMAVNLSVRQFEQPELVDQVARILAETGLEPRYLELEVTESLMMQNLEAAIATLQALRNLGVTLALDDFGTGYSSLNYLSRFPIHTLKIDQSFVRNVIANQHDAVITKAIIALANSLGLNITAEGVETQEQFQYMKTQGCDEVQGYYFSRPVAAEVLTELLQRELVSHSVAQQVVQLVS